MGSAISYVLGKLCGRGSIDIPRQILEIGFKDEWLDEAAPVTLENKILNWVIKDRVIMDMDLIHGEEILVDLTTVEAFISDNFTRIYNIPPRLTNNREIVSVISVSYATFGTRNSQWGSLNTGLNSIVANDLNTAATQVMNSVGSVPTA